MYRRIMALTLLTLSDFHLHLDVVHGWTTLDPIWPFFHWIFLQPFYDEFWSVHWGLGFVLAVSLVLKPPDES